MRYFASPCHYYKCQYKEPHWRVRDREAPMSMPIEDFDGEGSEHKCKDRVNELNKKAQGGEGL